MRLRIHNYPDGSVCQVTLSRRNLLTLLQKLEMAGSARTVIGQDCPEGWTLVLQAEDDDEHYAQRPAPPGPMHPETEAFIDDRVSPDGREDGQDKDQDLDQVVLPPGVERPDPGHFRHDILAQGEVWFDRFGQLHRIDEMPLSYLFNVLAFLERRAEELFAAELCLEVLTDLTGLSREKSRSTTDYPDPSEWLRQTPLVKALVQAAEEQVRSDG
jgi:hypothetical protein